MSMEKRNVVEPIRTPPHEFKDLNGDWAKVAADRFNLEPQPKPADKPPVPATKE